MDVKNNLVISSNKIIMFSPIIMLATNQITITDEEIPQFIPDYPEQIRLPVSNNVRPEPPSESFLSVLDDKNRIIANLKKQLQNQKSQLSFYFKKELDRAKIEEFSESCTPQASEESLPLNLAINKFCRQAGIKTKLSLLHEHMNRLDYKISRLLRDQEFVLRKIVSMLCELVKSQETARRVDFKSEFGRLIFDPSSLEFFDKLLCATIGLSRKLNSFKICCDRVLLIEEEKNYIVEQVYSMPVEERINRNYLVGIQMEKVQLEHEIRRISRHQAAGRHRIKELNVIENILHNLQWELNSSFLKNEESCISKMVKKINSEARLLLEMTKEQKRRFECEISKTKGPDSNRILLYIKTASDGDKTDKKELERCGIKTEEEIRLFEMVKGEVDVIKNKIREAAETENRKLRDECEKLKSQITQVLLDNSRTKVTNTTLRQELAELKLERKIELQKLKQERDAYKSQVEDLQAIREAYAQLVDKQPNTSQMEKEFFEQIDDRDKKILELHNRTLAQNHEIDKLKVKLLDQNDQIVVLNRFINLTRPNSAKESDNCEKAEFRNDTCCNKNTHQQGGLNIASKSQEKYNNISNINKVRKEDLETEKSENILSRNRLSNNAKKGISKRGVVPSSKKKSSRKNNHANLLHEEKKNSLTCCKIYSRTNGKTSDIVKTVVTTNEGIDGNVKMEQSSVFSMEIKYTSKEHLIENDEFELFKDCSAESMILENRYEKLTRTVNYIN